MAISAFGLVVNGKVLPETIRKTEALSLATLTVGALHNLKPRMAKIKVTICRDDVAEKDAGQMAYGFRKPSGGLILESLRDTQASARLAGGEGPLTRVSLSIK